MSYDGKTESGLWVISDPRRPKRRGLVLNTHECLYVEPGDEIIFQDGTDEMLYTQSGEELGFLSERNVMYIVLDDELVDPAQRGERNELS